MTEGVVAIADMPRGSGMRQTCVERLEGMVPAEGTVKAAHVKRTLDLELGAKLSREDMRVMVADAGFHMIVKGNQWHISRKPEIYTDPEIREVPIEGILNKFLEEELTIHVRLSKKELYRRFRERYNLGNSPTGRYLSLRVDQHKFKEVSVRSGRSTVPAWMLHEYAECIAGARRVPKRVTPREQGMTTPELLNFYLGEKLRKNPDLSLTKKELFSGFRDTYKLAGLSNAVLGKMVNKNWFEDTWAKYEGKSIRAFKFRGPDRSIFPS